MKQICPIIFICGLGGAGKSTFADRLSDQFLGDSVIVRLDWYLKFPTNQRKEKIRAALQSQDETKIRQEENPQQWNDFKKLKQDLNTLRRTSKLDIHSAWNQATGEKDLQIHLQISGPKTVIICEGIYLLHPEIAEVADMIICLQIPDEEAERRIKIRDTHRSSDEYLRYKAELKQKYDVPYFKKFIKNADFVLSLDGQKNNDERKVNEIYKLIQNKFKI